MTTYYCPTCDLNHEETPKADFTRTILPDRCSAQYRQIVKPGLAVGQAMMKDPKLVKTMRALFGGKQ